MKFAELAMGVLLVAGTSSASTLVGVCGSFSNPAPNLTLTGTWTCPSFAALGGVGTLTTEYVVFESDYSSGLSPTVTAVTNWTFSGPTFAFTSDITTSTGDSSSTTPVSSDGLTFNSLVIGPPLIFAGFYDSTSTFGTPTVAFSNSATNGEAVQTTGYAEVVYSTDRIATTPEPSSFLLLGGGLLGTGFFSRKRFAGRRA